MIQHQEELMLQGFVAVTREGTALPTGYVILAQADTYVACGPEEVRSGFCGSYEMALDWAKHCALRQSGMFPEVGELWGYAGRTAIICGNSISEQKTIWVMDWHSGDRADAPVAQLEQIEDRKTLTEAVIVAKFSEWARAGNSDAIWWLAWWFEGMNHPKSVWYYVAAMRANPKRHGWVQDRVMSDSRTAYMCEGIPDPDLSFLDGIPEIQGQAIGSNWAKAVEMAESAVHVSATTTTMATAERERLTIFRGGKIIHFPKSLKQ